MNSVQLSPHFSLSEFTRSQAAVRLGREVVVEAGSEVFGNLGRLCLTVLEPLRIIVGEPVVILSGFRPEWLNSLVGGSRTSDHLLGLAADLVVPGRTPLEVCELVRGAGLPFRQCIHEFGRWCHLSAPRAGEEPRRECLTARSQNGRTSYLAGLLPATDQEVA